MIDVGGSKIAWAVITGVSQNHDINVLYRHSDRTVLGIEGVRLRIHDILAESKDLCRTLNISLANRVGIAFPGNHRSHVILKGSAENLGQYPCEWDSVFLDDLLPPSYSLFLVNDAVAQMLGGLLLFPPANTIDRAIYLGPGTGLGGGVAHRNDSDWVPLTDGHIFDIALTSIWGRAMAEDILSARGVVRATGLESHHLTSDNLLHHQFEVDQWCNACCRLIHALHRGSFNKVRCLSEWSYLDYVAISGVSYFMIGGSILTKGVLATYFHTYWDGYALENHLSELVISPLYDHEYCALFYLYTQLNQDH